MSRYLVSPLAQADIEEISLYIALDSPARSDAFIDRLHVKFSELSKHPGVGRPRDDLLAGARAYAMGQYLIFYRGRKNALQVLRVYHAKRNSAGIRLA